MWKYLVFILVNLCCVHGSEDINIFMTDISEEGISKYNSITECIVVISKRVLYFQPTIAILEKKEQGNKANVFIHDLISKIKEHDIPRVVFKDITDLNNHDLHNHSLIISFFDKCEDIINFDYDRISLEMKIVFIISDTSSDDCYKTIEEISELVSKFDFTFIFQDVVTDENKMYTVFPRIDQHTCLETVEKPTHINTCINGTVKKKEIFPIKNVVNLNKCPLRVGMATLPPFSTIKNKESLNTYDRIEQVKGSDYEIIKIVTKYFNATLDLHYIYRHEENPAAHKLFVKLVLNNSLDICAGGLYRIYGKKFEYSGIYVRQDVFWIYYAERAYRSWENLIHKLTDVYVFIIFYITYAFVWYFISFVDKDAVSLTSTFLYSWGALVGATSLQEAKSLKQKLLNLMYLIMCIYLAAYISMQLYAFLTIRAPPQTFKTNDEIMRSGRTPYLIRTTKYFVNDEKYTKFANSSADCTTFIDCAAQTLQNNGLTIILQGNFYAFQAHTAVNDEARILRATENIITVYNEMIIRKNSPLVVKFKTVVQRLFEVGITRRLFTEAIGLSVVGKANRANSNMLANSYSCQAGCSITLRQFAGVFYAWIFGCVLSSIVFVIEIVTTRKTRQSLE